MEKNQVIDTEAVKREKAVRSQPAIPDEQVIDATGHAHPRATQEQVREAQEELPRDAGSAFAAKHRTGTKTRVITQEEAKR